jgi:hypothetical protein
MDTSTLLLTSLIKHYESDKAEAIAMLNLYFNNPQPVADHSDIMGELNNWTSKLAQAEENLAVLYKHLGEPNS